MEDNFQDYAMLSFSGINLMLPQDKILSIEVTHTLSTDEIIPGSVGNINSGDEFWPVFLLSEEFDLVTQLPEGYRYCVGVGSERLTFGLACESITSHKVEDATVLTPISDCMKLPENPLHAFMIHEDKLVMVSSANALGAYLETKVAQ